MSTILLAGKFSHRAAHLEIELPRRGFQVVKSPDENGPLPAKKPDVALIDFTDRRAGDGYERIKKVKTTYSVPVIVLVAGESLENYEPIQGVEDFVVVPCSAAEVEARIKQVIWEKQNLKSETTIKRGDLVIDLSSYKVFLAGCPIDLTFKEYELLRLLASNPGKVFSRETLLNQVWGYDYYGGDRTVDVHIRRLRSKIEDVAHSFIETVWNVGYRFTV